MHIIFFGFKSSGKTTLGRALAKLLELSFIDTDEWLLSQMPHFQTIPQMYRSLGEACFRSEEKKAVLHLKDCPDSVVSLGGGTVLDPENTTFLRSIGTLFYLDVDEKELKRRIFKGPLPLFLDPVAKEESFRKVYAARKSIYEAIAYGI